MTDTKSVSSRCRLSSKLPEIHKRLKLFSVLLGRNNLLAAVKARRADVMTTMSLAGRGLNSQSRVGQEVMSAMIAALAGRFLILLDSHFLTPRG